MQIISIWRFVTDDGQNIIRKSLIKNDEIVVIEAKENNKKNLYNNSNKENLSSKKYKYCNLKIRCNIKYIILFYFCR